MNVRQIVNLLGVALVVVSLTGCGGSAKQNLIGKWELDMERLTKTDEASAQAANFAKGMLQMMKLEMEFKADGTAAISMMGRQQTGRWEVVKSSGKTVEIKLSKDGEEKAETVIVTFIDRNHIEISRDGEGDPMHLKRLT